MYFGYICGIGKSESFFDRSGLSNLLSRFVDHLILSQV